MPNTLLSFDFGTKRIGVAVGQTITKTARPLTTLQVNNQNIPWDKITDLISQWQPHALIVGLPLNMDGTPQTITDKVETFIKTLKTKTDLPVHACDERLSTVAAREKVFEQHGYRGLKKTELDSVAAAIILEHWLEKNK